MTTNSINYHTEAEWRGHPDRPCKDDMRYADLTLVKGEGSGKERERMRLACFACPVFRMCRDDLLTHGKDWEFYGIQAGVRGKT